jgi:hypothetical protein
MSVRDVVANLGQPIGRYSADEYGRSLARPAIDSVFTYSHPYSLVTFWVEFDHDALVYVSGYRSRPDSEEPEALYRLDPDGVAHEGPGMSKYLCSARSGAAQRNP